MDDMNAKSIQALKDQKEYLSRELADACRDFVNLKYKYEEVAFGYQIVKETLALKMVADKEAESVSSALSKIKQDVEIELMKKTQSKKNRRNL